LTYSLFPVLSTSDITETYEVCDSCYAYEFFTVVTLQCSYYLLFEYWRCHWIQSDYTLLNNYG